MDLEHGVQANPESARLAGEILGSVPVGFDVYRVEQIF
jgi:hypothetical protein